jgi:cyclopropane fatty-acyl-phospholipid synthase-like methyltransferase
MLFQMDIPSDWWRTFFQGITVDMWLQAVPDAATRQEADFVAAALGVAAPARLLDVPCGGGRHAVALAEQGYALTAVDLSADFLKAARTQCRDLPIEWHERDMRDLHWQAE